MTTEPVPDRPEARPSEARLLEMRSIAEREGRVHAAGIRPPGAPFPKASPETGYYGMPLLKQPQWKWQVPLYFFVGGAAGASAVIGEMARWVARDRQLARHARLVAAAGAMLSSGLLIGDLGRPERFLAMLRVFKKQSPMSVGAWVLAAFGTCSGAAAFSDLVSDYFDAAPVRLIGNVAGPLSAALGLPLHNYTGVLIGATAVPVWNRNIATLPLHFGISGVNSAVSTLELLGNEHAALNWMGMGAAAVETWEGVHLERRSEAALEPVKHGASGWLTRIGGVLSGPAPLALRVVSAATGARKMRRAAAVSSLAGSIVTRYAWMYAGRVSARNWRLPLEIGEGRPR